jgi:hypothetical protein
MKVKNYQNLWKKSVNASSHDWIDGLNNPESSSNVIED